MPTEVTTVARDESGRPDYRTETAVSRAGSPLLRRDAVADLSPGRALDIATGHGRNAIFLAERGWTVDAIDISRAMLDPARRRATKRDVSVNWLLADVDDYCFPSGAYDLVTISFFDARDRLDAILGALAPGGVLYYEHHLVRDTEGAARVDARYRFESDELWAAVPELTVEHYAEEPDARRVELVARKPVE